MDKFPKSVGIIAGEIYFPRTFVSQSDLEIYDRVPPGKYTTGLGQRNMAFCGDLEDINSICLTVVHNLLEKYNISPDQVGRLEVGTETLVDKSKSVKTTLMTLFGKNTEIEGVDTINACYGGTNALFNSVNWMESSSWDGRYAIVVAGDIAVYEPGPARPTGGAGVVALLIGPNAPIAFERGLRSTYMEHAFDFYKPKMVSEYPRVDGKLSNTCYIRALDNCYSGYAKKFEKRFGTPFGLDSFDYAMFHQPYQKLVQKSFARFYFHDYLINGKEKSFDAFKKETLESTYENRDIEKIALTVSKNAYDTKVAPSTFLGNECGNMYCGSLYGGLLSLIYSKAENLPGKRLLMFSYGSGLAASMFSFKVESPVTHIKQKLNLVERLNARVAITPEKFTETLFDREKNYTASNFKPSTPLNTISPGSYYLSGIDNLERRSYQRIPSNARSFHTFRQQSNAHSIHNSRLQNKLQSSSFTSKSIPRQMLNSVKFIR